MLDPLAALANWLVDPANFSLLQLWWLTRLDRSVGNVITFALPNDDKLSETEYHPTWLRENGSKIFDKINPSVIGTPPFETSIKNLEDYRSLFVELSFNPHLSDNLRRIFQVYYLPLPTYPGLCSLIHYFLAT